MLSTHRRILFPFLWKSTLVILRFLKRHLYLYSNDSDMQEYQSCKEVLWKLKRLVWRCNQEVNIKLTKNSIIKLFCC